MGLPHVLRALQLLEQDPDYRFTLDQSCYVQPFLERYPEAGDAFREFVRQGRLAIVGGTHVMHDGNMPGPESCVRQILYGKTFFRQALGIEVDIAWQLDTFGHHAQTPQILRLAGYRSFWFFRGVPSNETRSEFLWEGLDGTRVAAYWLPESYAVAYGSPRSPEEFARFVRQRYETLGRFTDRAVRVAPAGADVCEPEDHVAPLARRLREDSAAKVLAHIAVPADYERAVPPTDDWPVVHGELNPIFQGTYSSRIELKQRTRALETLLTDAEKLGAMLAALGDDAYTDPLWEAWEPMLFNQAHDLMSGVMTDHVYEDTLAHYHHAQRVGTRARDRRLEAYVSRIETSGPGVPLAVVNTLPWTRTDMVTVEAGFAGNGVRGVRVLDADGRDVPVQISDAALNPDGTLRTADVAFVAHDVAPLGHAVYHLLPVCDAVPLSAPEPIHRGAQLTNGRLRVELDERGALIGLWMDQDEDNLLSGPANVLAQERDEGDFWEPYRPLDGGSRIAMRQPHPVPANAIMSNGDLPSTLSEVRGPVFSEIRVSGMLGASRFMTAVRLIHAVDRIDIHTTLQNEDRFVRYRALFPSAWSRGQRFDEIPFGAIERPVGIEYPAQNWMDWSDGSRGLALLNRGLPGNNVVDGTLMLSLLRSTRIVAYGFGGGYEPGMTSETGFGVGRLYSFKYALVPHRGRWRDALLARRGQEFNCPFIVRKTQPHSGSLPPRWGLVSDLPEGLCLTSLRPISDGRVIVRLYEALGRRSDRVSLGSVLRLRDAQELDLMDRPVRALPVERGRLQLSFRPFEIKTICVRLDPGPGSPENGPAQSLATRR